MENFEYYGGGRFFAVTNVNSRKPELEGNGFDFIDSRRPDEEDDQIRPEIEQDQQQAPFDLAVDDFVIESNSNDQIRPEAYREEKTRQEVYEDEDIREVCTEEVVRQEAYPEREEVRREAYPEREEVRREAYPEREEVRQEAYPEREEVRQEAYTQREEVRREAYPEREEVRREAYPEREEVRQEAYTQREEVRREAYPEREEVRREAYPEREEVRQEAYTQREEVRREAYTQREEVSRHAEDRLQESFELSVDDYVTESNFNDEIKQQDFHEEKHQEPFELSVDDYTIDNYVNDDKGRQKVIDNQQEPFEFSVDDYVIENKYNIENTQQEVFDDKQEPFELVVDDVYEKNANYDYNDGLPTPPSSDDDLQQVENQQEPFELVVDDYINDNNVNDDWPTPPEQKRNQKPKLSSAKSDPVLYTSFLTIDVSNRRNDVNISPISEDNHRRSLLNLVTGNSETSTIGGLQNVDQEDLDKIRHDLEMISKYLLDMPLAASLWPQNYDVLRDLVKLYLAAKNGNNAILEYLLDYFLKLDWPAIYLKCLRKIMNNYPQVFLHSSDRKIPFEDPTPETLDMTEVSIEYAVAVIFQVILSLAAEFTEVHQESKQNGHKGFIKFLFLELLPKLHGIQWGKNTAREEFLLSATDIIYNFAESSNNFPSFYECNAVETLINLRRETENIGGNRVNIGCLLALSFLIDDRNNHLVINEPAQISMLILYIEECLSRIDHCFADFNVIELIEGLTRISSHDRNKLLICKYGGIATMFKVLKKATDDDERISVCNLLWSLSFVHKCRNRILNHDAELLNIIRRLQGSNNNSLKKAASFLIWELEDKYQDHGGLKTDSEIQHLLLSCHPEQLNTMLKISKRLKEKGYKVRFNVDEEPEEIAESVENAAVVLIGLSRKYKHNPACFAEADYAFELSKQMIPLAFECNYKADGWLGMLAGSKVWLDFTDDVKFDGHIQLLLRQLGDRGKSERSVNILYINENQGGENREDVSAGNRLLDISRWGNEEVLEWLQKNNLKTCVSDDKLYKLRGSHLIRLHQLRKESPDFYYNSLEPQLGFSDVIDMMEFTQALEALTERD